MVREGRLVPLRAAGPFARVWLNENETRSQDFVLAAVVALLARLLHKTTLAIATPSGTKAFAVDLAEPFSSLLGSGVPGERGTEDAYVVLDEHALAAARLVPAIWAERVGDAWQISLSAAGWSEQTAERVLAYLTTLMEDAARNASLAAGVLALMDEEQASSLYERINATEASYPRVTLQDLITEQELVDPAADAVIFDGIALSYGELGRQSDELARRLTAVGADQERPVVLVLPRSERLPVVMLAALKAGSFFVPLDPSHPRQRLIEIVEECRPAAVMVTSQTAEMFPGPGFPLFRMDEAAEAVAFDPSREQAKAGAHAKAYTIYTSGTTGKPKGVMIPQRALVNFVTAAQREPGFRRGDRLLAVATLSFDMSIMDVFLPLVSGGTVVIASEADARDPARLGGLLEKAGITCMQATPTTWRMLLANGWKGKKGLRMLSGGEALPRDVANALLEADGEELKELWNCYGPTETTVYSSFLRMRTEDGPVGIGGPIANTSFYIADANGTLLPPEIAGELYIGGDGVALGYFERPALNGEKFTVNRWNADTNQRLFHTGDAARFRGDGTLDFFGRLDSQVKLRGYRIEPGEIEAVLRTHPLVADAAVILREDEPGEPWLVGYLAKAGSAEISLGTALADIRAHAAQSLPGYMLPARLVVLDALPLTGSGKTDKRALARLEAPLERRVEKCEVEREGARAEKPIDAIESSLLKVFREVLRLPAYGMDDNFFEHGGYSLLAVRLFARIANALGRELPITTLFDAPTVRKLALLVRAGEKLAAVVPVRAEGNRPPFFLVQSYLLYGLASSMVPKAHPIFGLREADAMESDELPLQTRVATFADAIDRMAPSGPIYLGGWCAAAPLTVEIARRLQAGGRAIGMIALFDAESPGFTQQPASGNPRIARWRAAVKYHMARLRTLSWRARLSYMAERGTQQAMQWVEWVYMRHRRVVTRLQHLLPFLPNALFYNRWTQLRDNGQARIEPIDAKFLLFRALDVVVVPGSDKAMGWTAIARGGVEVIFVPGHHESMFHEPQLSVLRDKFAQAMLEAESSADAGA